MTKMQILLDEQNKICVKDKDFNFNKHYCEETKIKNNRIMLCFRDNHNNVMIKEQGFNFDKIKVNKCKQ
jgi:hypothetical protein